MENTKIKNLNKHNIKPILLNFISNSQYKEAFLVLDDLKTIGDIKAYNTFIYLMAYITKLPSKYIKYYKSLTVNDFLPVDPTINKEIFNYRMLRSNYHQLIRIKEQDDNIDNRILVALLKEAYLTETENNKYMTELAKEHKHIELLDYINESKTHRNISIGEKDLFRLLSEYIVMDYTNEVPEIIYDGATTICGSIKVKDYKKALMLADKTHYCDDDRNAFYYVLSDTVNLINIIDSSKKISKVKKKIVQ